MTLQTCPLPVLNPSIGRVRALLERRPLYLIIETTNICNAKCVFCAYPKMTRDKSVMDPALFEKIVADYVDMGGGAVSLTPIVGDALIDLHLLDRIRCLRREPSITHLSVTTNAIAWTRYAAADQRFLLENIDTVSVSIGGLDRESYREMFGVDRFDKVHAAIESMCAIKAQYRLPAEIHLLFRVNRPIDELLSDPRAAAYQRPEINNISGINRFGNWGGVVQASDLPTGAFLIQPETDPAKRRQEKKNPCFVFHLAPEITATGLVSACGCMNAEARELILGDVRETHLKDIWNGQAYKKLKSAFGADRLSDICKQCSYYQDGEAFLRSPGLEHFQVGDNPWALMRKHATSPHRLLSRTLDELATSGFAGIALYGAGNFTRSALSNPAFDAKAYPLRAIVDDNPALIGGDVCGLPIVSRDHAMTMKLDAVVLSTDRFVEEMLRAALPLRENGVVVTPIVTHENV